MELSGLPDLPGHMEGGSVVSQRGDLTFLPGRVSPAPVLRMEEEGGRLERRQKEGPAFPVVQLEESCHKGE